jgi:maltokinase
VNGTVLELRTDERWTLEEMMAAWLAGRPDPDDRTRAGRRPPAVTAWPSRPEIVRAELLEAQGAPLLDVRARVGQRTAHGVLGIAPGVDDGRVLGSAKALRGLGMRDEAGNGMVVDALREPALAGELLSCLIGHDARADAPTVLREDPRCTVLGFPGRCSLTVLTWLAVGPHPGIELLVALDDAGFNHLAAPIALWRRDGLDLGVVQEPVSGAVDGWALAQTSLRDVLASGLAPSEAGGDFAGEAAAIGLLTARMHLALASAFGVERSPVSAWVTSVETLVREVHPSLLEGSSVVRALDSLGSAALTLPTVRVHGDFHLSRLARTDQGWVLADWMNAGRPDLWAEPRHRFPMADVASMFWSLHRLVRTVLNERRSAAVADEVALTGAWEDRNRSAFLDAYLGTPGIESLVSPDRQLAHDLIVTFELERAWARLADQSVP